jgi:Family of unknown function (DUF6069)
MTGTTATRADSHLSASHPSAAHARRHRTAALMAVSAVVTNSLIYLAAHALGVTFTLTDPAKTQQHTLVPPEIIMFTALFFLLGWGTLAVLERFTRRPVMTWTALATGVLLLSFVPVAAVQATTGTKLTLSLIHLCVAAALLPVLLRANPPRRPTPPA